MQLTATLLKFIVEEGEHLVDKAQDNATDKCTLYEITAERRVRRKKRMNARRGSS